MRTRSDQVDAVLGNGITRWEDWLRWNKLCNVDGGRPEVNREVAMLLEDNGRSLTFTRVVARRNEPTA